MSPEQMAVEQLATDSTRSAAMAMLAGGVTATALRKATVTPAAFDALLGGLRHKNPRVRWWSIQILDHVPDARAMAAIAPLLYDPVPRVRRNAAHALGCADCKPDWSGELPDAARSRLAEMASVDASAKVRAEAARALSCLA
jgi:HEAT repeat protein